MSRPLLVTATPPTPNGDLHIGHLAGPYLGADAFRRYAAMRGRDVVYVTGTDDHQSYLVRKAELRGEGPATTARHYGGLIRRSLALADVAVDGFGQPVDAPGYDGVVSAFFEGLRASGAIRPADVPSLWCPACDRDLVDYDAQGSCGYCGEPCDVGICEECGRPSSPLTLRSPRCTRCGTVPVPRTVRRLCLDLREWAGALDSYHATVRTRPHTRALWEAMRADGLPVVAVAHPGHWGVPVRDGEFAGHRWWGMAEMVVGYLATTMAYDPAGWSRYWTGDAEIVQFCGFDNSYWQTILHPALLAADGRYALAARTVVNEFHQLDGRKFSSSKEHAVWVSELLAAVPSDHVRYHLCGTAPEERQGNFTLAGFAAAVNDDLAGVVEDALACALRAAAGRRQPPGVDIVGLATSRADAIGRALEPETFSLRAAVGEWRSLVLDLAQLAPVAAADDVGSALTVVAATAYPLLPRFAARLWERLGVAAPLATHPWGSPAVPRSLPDPAVEPCFARVSIGAPVAAAS